MPSHPRIIGSATALPEFEYSQDVVRDNFCLRLFGDNWAARSDVATDVRTIARTFASSRVEHRQLALDLGSYYSERRTTGERMLDYERLSYPLARDALVACLGDAEQSAEAITDFIVVSCTGYGAPGLDILLARDLGMHRNVRRLIVGHMGCLAAIAGLRSALASLRAHECAVVALITVELCSLHGVTSLDSGIVSGSALFGDAAAALLLASPSDSRGPELIDTFCLADFKASDQISWKITDEGFLMGLSRRIPITLRRHAACAVDRLLSPHELNASDITHWIVHPGGPDILEVVSGELALSEEQMAMSWEVLREHGNCSSSTVLLILDALLRSGRTRPGEWGVMMAFGPGLTLETCLLRF